MKALISIGLVIAAAAVAAALDLGTQAPTKPALASTSRPPDPAAVRQGGDTIADAFVIPSLPFTDTGTTSGYTNDYDAVCPIDSQSPDVVYSYVAEAGIESIDVDLCHSSYDTKVYVYDANLNLIDCNEDYYFDPPCYTYSSRLNDVPVETGQVYYIIVDGYYGAQGPYQIDVTEYVPCVVDCPPDGFPEGEPDLFNGYVDDWNGGCNSGGDDGLFESIPDAGDGVTILCGVGGWFRMPGGSPSRDTDWYVLTMGVGGQIDVTINAEQRTLMCELGPQDCSEVWIVQSATTVDCVEASLRIQGYDIGSPVWLFISASPFLPPSGEYPLSYDYVCWISGTGTVATERASWSTMKALWE